MIQYSLQRTLCRYRVRIIATTANPNSSDQRLFFFWRSPVFLSVNWIADYKRLDNISLENYAFVFKSRNILIII